MTQAQKERTAGPWHYVPSTEHHGAYITSDYGSDIADCYTMSNPSALSVRNGGDSRPVPHCGEQMDANASFIVTAVNAHDELVAALRRISADTLTTDERSAIIDAAFAKLERKP